MGCTCRAGLARVLTGSSALRLQSRFMRVVTVAIAIAGTSAAWAVPAHADEVRTLTGPATHDPDVHLTYVGCESFFGPAAAPQSRLNLGPFTAPVGRRSLGLVPSGPGTATGPFARFDSLTGLDATFSATGGSGVSYVWTVTADTPPGAAWAGRTAIAPARAAWRQVAVSALTYDWTLVDLTTQVPLGTGGSATPGQFAAKHGDGSGFSVTGLGCDGASFNIDAVSAGGVVYDFEGITLRTAIATTTDGVRPDGTIELTGAVTDDSGRTTGDPLVLESRTPGGTWGSVGGAVLGDATGVARVVAPVTETTEFRWHRPESQYADEGWSETITVAVPEAEKPENAENAEKTADTQKTDKDDEATVPSKK